MFGYLFWQRRAAQQEEYQTSLGLARVLSATFQATDRLEVGRVDGALDVTTVDPGLFRFLRSAQKATLPYSVTYQLDLSKLDTDDYRWDAKNRVLRVTIPDVAPTAPNIDETRRRTLATDGVFVTREAYRQSQPPRRGARDPRRGDRGKEAGPPQRRPRQCQKGRREAARNAAFGGRNGRCHGRGRLPL